MKWDRRETAMKKDATTEPDASTMSWADVEEWARLQIQSWMQGLLVEGGDGVLGTPALRAKRDR